MEERILRGGEDAEGEMRQEEDRGGAYGEGRRDDKGEKEERNGGRWHKTMKVEGWGVETRFEVQVIWEVGRSARRLGGMQEG